jgi:hypothetical protein
MAAPTVELRLRRFDMSTIKDSSVVVMIGKRHTGKSWLMRDLLSRHTSLPSGVVISPTEDVNNFFSDMIPPMFITNEFSPAVLENLINRQKRIIRKARDEDGIGNDPIDPRAFLIMDDCIYDASVFNNTHIRYIFLNGRHIRVLTIVSMQYALGITPLMRTNVDYVFILREGILANQRRLYEGFAGCVPTFEMFQQLMAQCTQNYECLVVDNTSTSNKLTDQLFWYKACEPPPFRLCPSAFWNISRQIAERAEQCPETEVYDVDKLRKKTMTNLRVVKS